MSGTVVFGSYGDDPRPSEAELAEAAHALGFELQHEAAAPLGLRGLLETWREEAVNGAAGGAAPRVGGALPAVILGHLAVRDLRTTGERGRELAVAGMVTGYVTIGVGLLLVAVGVLGGAAIQSDQQDVPDACTSKTGNFTHEQRDEDRRVTR